jgi:hypothetical protein
MSMYTSCIDTRATLPLPIFLALEVRQIPIVFVWLDVQDLSLLDITVSSSSARKQWLSLLKSNTCGAIDGWHHSHSSIRWLIMRGICVNQLLVNRKHRNSISDLTFEAVRINGNRTLRSKKVNGLHLVDMG